jgi:small conductance mechanosensitive channel
MHDIAPELSNFASSYLIPLAWKALGAILMWVVGGQVIKVADKLSGRAMAREKVEPTLAQYVRSTLYVVLRIALVIAILSVFGIETTSFAALIAAGGVAVGVAWSGLLANFAAGAFLIVLRPFKVGDAIGAAGVTGTVREIGMFATKIDTEDNLRVIVGNNKLFSENIVNYTHNPYRRVDLKTQMPHEIDPLEAIAKVRERVAKIPNVLSSPEPSVDVLEFNADGTLLTVRPFCHNDHYSQVYFDTNRAIQEIAAFAGQREG